MKYSIKKNSHSFLEVFPKPTEKFLEEIYSKKYFKNKLSASYSKFYSIEELHNRVKRSDLYIDIALSLSSKKKKDFLEIGAGEGFLMKAAFKKKLNVTGVDFQKDQIESQNPDMLNFFKMSNPYIYLKKDKKKYDFIASMFVLEHLREPIKFIKILKSKLKKNGIIIISVPNDFKDFQHNFLKKKIITKKYWIAPPLHLNYFNNKNIELFFKKMNLKILEAISDFPIEILLASGRKNYLNSRQEGKKAHQTRLIVDNFILSQGTKHSIDFYKACHNVGLGRSMIYFLKK